MVSDVNLHPYIAAAAANDGSDLDAATKQPKLGSGGDVSSAAALALPPARLGQSDNVAARITGDFTFKCTSVKGVGAVEGRKDVAKSAGDPVYSMTVTIPILTVGGGEFQINVNSAMVRRCKRDPNLKAPSFKGST